MADSRDVVQKTEGTKPESFDSRIESLKGAMAVLDEAVVQLAEAMLKEAKPKQRARILAVLAALGHDGQSEMFEGSDGS